MAEEIPETDPLGIFLVSSGTRGDRLLFRYPYATASEDKNDVSAPINATSKMYINFIIFFTEVTLCQRLAFSIRI